jgi:hypothetical protein
MADEIRAFRYPGERRTASCLLTVQFVKVNRRSLVAIDSAPVVNEDLNDTTKILQAILAMQSSRARA